MITRAENDKSSAGDDGADGGGECPLLRLVCSSARKLDEQQHPASQRNQGCACADALLSPAKHTKDEHQPHTEPREDRAENDQPDVALAVLLLEFRDPGCRYFGSHRASSDPGPPAI
jgi:hypothetical protein